MTDHSSGSDDRDDYRLSAGTPQDAVPPGAQAAQGGAGTGNGGTDGPPPQLSGQPGWAYSPTEMAAPQIPQPGGPGVGYSPTEFAPQVPQVPQPGGAGGPGVAYSPTEFAPQVPQPGGPGVAYSPTEFAPQVPQPSAGQTPQPGYGYPQPPQPAQPAQGYGYPSPQAAAPAPGDGAAQAQPYPLPPMAQPVPGLMQQPMQPMPGQPYGSGQAPYDPQQAAYAQQQQPFPQQAPYGPQPDAQGQWPQMPPLPTEGQPGYPYPGAYQQPTPPRSGLSRGAIGGIIAGAVALAIVAVVAILLIPGGGGSNGGGGGGSVPTLAASWSVKGKTTDQQVGTWVTDKYFVRASSSGVQAYSLTDGSVAWTAQPLSGPGVPCAMSPTLSSSGIGTIGFGPDTTSCTTLVGVDTHTGKTLWSTALTNSTRSMASGTTTFIDGSVGVIVNGTVLGGVDLTTGNAVWGYKARGQYCDAYPYGGAGVVLVDDYCADVQPSYTLSALDGATGKQLWQKTETDNVQFNSVLSGSPLIATTEDSGDPVAQRFDSSGNETPISLTDKIQLTTNGNPGTQLLGSSALLIPTSNSSSKPDVSAVNPSTGSPLWTYDGTTHGGGALLRDATQSAASGGTSGGSNIYAMSLVPGYSSSNGPTVVSLDPSTGKPTDIAHLPASANTIEYGEGEVYLLPNHEVLIASMDFMSGKVIQLFK
ncbi:hypothetical protein DN069_11675 [Streptacidiphilus pinicola]|uniref:Pyrrolo-quinoline quinone repeat domain-containing protein n=1 Tax=Streptacidiphilus pinicola TaxID=2219663 RepID=A0A2X0KF04_9ACTN|nr:PQQ-binding-like beta-propeller repeat protein [Streptacidiphilus pinicola]RAG85430.1 hypothetical protein DN069_11675 [Streptacidiphilus pinicola]